MIDELQCREIVRTYLKTQRDIKGVQTWVMQPVYHSKIKRIKVLLDKKLNDIFNFFLNIFDKNSYCVFRTFFWVKPDAYIPKLESIPDITYEIAEIIDFQYFWKVIFFPDEVVERERDEYGDWQFGKWTGSPGDSYDVIVDKEDGTLYQYYYHPQAKEMYPFYNYLERKESDIDATNWYNYVSKIENLH